MYLFMDILRIKNLISKAKYPILMLIGILLFLFATKNYITIYQEQIKEENASNDLIDNFFENSQNSEEVIVNDNNKTNNTFTEDYTAVLEIPKIKLKRGIYSKEDKRNNVNKNIYLIDKTTLPDENNVSHIILAAHSGNSYISYFKNLHKLQIDDNVYFYFNGTKYIYKIIDKYEVEKTGDINLILTSESDITLITCKYNSNKQIVYVGSLIDKDIY